MDLSNRRVDNIVGEWEEGNVSYYYARFEAGMLYKFPKRQFKKKHPELVRDFEQRQADGLVEDFDPSTRRDIHPLCLPKGNESSAPPSDAELVADSLSEHSNSDGENAEDEDFEMDEDVPNRRQTRNGRAKLPFSPRKTRSRKIYTEDSDADSDNDASSATSSVIAPRRAKRKAARRDDDYDDEEEDDAMDEDEDEEMDDDDEEYGMSSRRSQKKKPKKKRRSNPAARPMYGRVRPIDELDYDSGYENTAPLRAHRRVCEKCGYGPAHELLAAEAGKKKKKKKGKGKAKRRGDDDDDLMDSDEERKRLENLGGWVQCLKCPVSYHWKCIGKPAQDEITKAIRDKEHAIWLGDNPEADPKDGPKKRSRLGVDEVTECICMFCALGSACMFCRKEAVKPDSGKEAVDGKFVPTLFEPASELVFRCKTCKRVAHYGELNPNNADNDPVEVVADAYQASWECDDCDMFKYKVDKILAWRSSPEDAKEKHPEAANYKDPLPREYFVKWEGRSYNRLNWVPHMFLLATSPGKLKNFILDGSKVELKKSDESTVSFGEAGDEAGSSSKDIWRPQDPCLDAEFRVPIQWKTVDRVLDVWLWHPEQKPKPKAKTKKGKGKKKATKKRVDSSDEMEVDEAVQQEYDDAFDRGEQPEQRFLETIAEWEERMEDTFSVKYANLVVYAFIKWDELSYDQATWDSPPRPDDDRYPAFERALERYLEGRNVTVKRMSAAKIKEYESRPPKEYKRSHFLEKAEDLELGQDPKLKLMPFQVDGFNWLCDNWWTHQPCILADEMGLGKTVQIATFIGQIASKWDAFPALVVVPNSTITNWVREFERWAPRLRVVPWYGEAQAREVIKKYELRHSHPAAGTTGAKYHVLVTTYEAITNAKDFGTVFKSTPRWEVLVVDEGQRLKSDASLLFRKLNELNTCHRVIMTGTPLNNNIRELFNLMNFLDPEGWTDLDALAQEYETLTEDLIKELHERLRPYFLRRIKSQVLTLPPKNEVIVPVSMSQLQKEMYRSILTHNSLVLQNLKTNNGPAQSRTKINNVLMQLRKCLQHPYIYSNEIEPVGLSVRETHEKLVDASAKLRFLKVLLPKLKARGHRVLLFSQFTMALDIIEDFLVGENFKFLRLDGNTKSADRQKGMDEFNREGSDIFVYLLTTRAGGVGINLFTADTVIIFDPDFNPHQDLQAIARAYRFGQKKTCLVFKLMVKQSAEERIVQIGKKKMVLDHLIVQKMDDEENGGEDVQSILTFGAQTLFQENSDENDIHYSEHDVDSLITKTEQDPGPEDEANKEGGGMFSFAKIWTADRDALEDVRDEDQVDSWGQTLEKINAEHARIQAEEDAAAGRGAKRKAARQIMYNDLAHDSPDKQRKKKRTKSNASSGEDDAYGVSDVSSVSGSDSEGDPDAMDLDKDDKVADPDVLPDGALPKKKRVRKPKEPALGKSVKKKPMQPGEFVMDLCGLCSTTHTGDAGCPMTEKSQNLAEYRMLLLHPDSNEESYELRLAAIREIDKTLAARGDVHLIVGQPLFLVNASTRPPKMKAREPEEPVAKKQKISATPPVPVASSSRLPSASIPEVKVDPPPEKQPRPLIDLSLLHKSSGASTAPRPSAPSTSQSAASVKAPKPRAVTMPSSQASGSGIAPVKSKGKLQQTTLSITRTPSLTRTPIPQNSLLSRTPPDLEYPSEPEPVAGPSKRASSPPTNVPIRPTKKPRPSEPLSMSVLSCDLCRGKHDLQRCPRVLAGIPSIQAEIKRLKNIGTNDANMVTARMEKVLRKYQREKAREVIDVSD
ncbi:hypothetical protein CYLTODRAFT_425826 [Cylindrobasidium torrendii FP15055 ss-10]|uniref:Chromatin remodeling factor mit1 n=1 Tax=Cylindrobasidium torrendii FP15055 ss-10 TaxID=1314674 RepID=A0A0D7B0N0_9AGAR|nr:hypothetical protein CYLTODRAFT_425826 [Cylindrobasidium torrendii FP15055 ss-10]